MPWLGPCSQPRWMEVSHPVRVAEEVGPREMEVRQESLGQFVPHSGPWPSVLQEAHPAGLPTASLPASSCPGSRSLQVCSQS